MTEHQKEWDQNWLEYAFELLKCLKIIPKDTTLEIKENEQ